MQNQTPFEHKQVFGSFPTDGNEQRTVAFSFTNTSEPMPPDASAYFDPARFPEVEKSINNLVDLYKDKIKPTDAAVKFDDGKTAWDLIPYDAVEEIGKVLMFGARKYAAHNWKNGGGFRWTRVFSSLMRHLVAWLRGQDNDPETGLSHLAHAGCNIFFLLHYTLNKDKYKNDDRVV